MGGALEAGPGGVKVRPEAMEVERLYHCLFGGKVVLAYKDAQQVLHCYEVDDPGLVGAVEGAADEAAAAAAIEEFAASVKLNE